MSFPFRLFLDEEDLERAVQLRQMLLFLSSLSRRAELGQNLFLHNSEQGFKRIISGLKLGDFIDGLKSFCVYDPENFKLRSFLLINVVFVLFISHMNF